MLGTTKRLGLKTLLQKLPRTLAAPAAAAAASTTTKTTNDLLLCFWGSKGTIIHIGSTRLLWLESALRYVTFQATSEEEEAVVVLSLVWLLYSYEVMYIFIGAKRAWKVGVQNTCRMRIRDLYSKIRDLFSKTRLRDQKNSRCTWTPWTP